MRAGCTFRATASNVHHSILSTLQFLGHAPEKAPPIIQHIKISSNMARSIYLSATRENQASVVSNQIGKVFRGEELTDKEMQQVPMGSSMFCMNILNKSHVLYPRFIFIFI